MSTAALFERLAPRYDELWTETAIGRAQRSAVWRVVDGLFHAGDRVLDIGCGTGEDAAHLAARGVLVHAVDASAAMVERARARGIAAEVVGAEELCKRASVFDGALSNFGALNCVEDLTAVARALGAMVRPGGYLAICTMGRFCAWETFYYAARGSFRKAGRRWSGRAGEIRYPTISELRADFAPQFKLLSCTGIGMLVPPSYVKLSSRAVRALARLDRFAPLGACADHRLLVFKRK